MQRVGAKYGAKAPQLKRPQVFVPKDRRRNEKEVREELHEAGFSFGGYDITRKPTTDAEVLSRIYFGFILKNPESALNCIRELLLRNTRSAEFYLKLHVEQCNKLLKGRKDNNFRRAYRYLDYLRHHFLDMMAHNV